MLALALFALAAASPAPAAPIPERGEQLYRVSLMRAAPGRLLELIAALRGAGQPHADGLLLRHSQGDQWDLMLLEPVAEVRLLPREAPPELLAWREDAFVRGPELAALPGFAGAGLCHVEMFLALPDKRADLLREREMENAYLRALGRPTNAIFTRELGAAWDAFTIGAYRSLKHFAEREDIAREASEAAARAAGFAGDDRIGPYLRSLIQSHHDTLATPVR
jgi:hypothetical protein